MPYQGRTRPSLLVLALSLLLLLSACKDAVEKVLGPDQATLAKREWEAKQVQEKEEQLRNCVDGKTQTLLKFDEELKAKRFREARLVVLRCTELTTDLDYLSRLKNAEDGLAAVGISEALKVLSKPYLAPQETVREYETLLSFKGTEAYGRAEQQINKLAARYEAAKALVRSAQAHDVVPVIGWTEDELLARKGHPGRRTRTVTSAGTTDQLVYCDGTASNCMHVLLRDGVVTAFQH